MEGFTKLRRKLFKKKNKPKVYIKEQKERMQNKFKPIPDREYMITDQCFWEQNPPEDYNVLDPKRKPHAVTLVDVENGTTVNLNSGSIIKVIKSHA